jgi:glutathione S-transferase
VPQPIKDKAREDLAAGFATLRRHAKIAPYVAGPELTLADVVFLYSVDLASAVSTALFGANPLADWPQGSGLLARLNENGHAQTIARAREAGRPAFIAAVRARLAAAAAAPPPGP